MPAFVGELTDQRIWDVITYIKSRWPREIQESQQSISAASE
jgi:mono/diheme cytochrome c family protein